MYNHSSKDIDEYLDRLNSMGNSGDQKDKDLSNLMLGILNNFSKIIFMLFSL